MDTHEVRLRSARRPGTWTLRWDDQAYHLFDPTGQEGYPSFSTLGFATVLDRHDLLIRHRIAFRMWDDRFESDGDPAAARAFARVLYPMLIRDEDDEKGAAALPVVRRWRAATAAVLAVAAAAPVPVASAAVRSRVGSAGVAALVGVGVIAWGVAARAARRAARRRAVTRAVAALSTEGWPTALPEGFGQLVCSFGIRPYRPTAAGES